MDSRPFDLLVRGGTCVLPGGLAKADVGVRDGLVEFVGEAGGRSALDVFDARGLHVLPGVIDAQVHFREPGHEHKEDLESGTRAAVLGGVTAVFEMPNTSPPTVDESALADKFLRARGRVHCDIGFFVGATAENADELGRLERLPGCVGVKVFMGSSTGSLLVADDATLRRVFRSGSRRVALHAEDEYRLLARRKLAEESGDVRSHPDWRDAECARLATERAIRLARESGRPIHLLHVTTAEEIPLLRQARDLATFEVPPQHLTLAAPECYERLGTLAQMNPPIREVRHREALWKAVSEGPADAVATDHAPHTLEEKGRPYPSSPSGMPGVQTMLPLMLHHVHEGRLSLERLVELVCAGPARIYGAAGRGRIEPGAAGSLTLVDLGAERTIERDWLASKCGWSPFEGMRVRGWPVGTVVRGRAVMRDGALAAPSAGEPVRFL